jgi:CRP-like cAMP-binding protein
MNPLVANSFLSVLSPSTRRDLLRHAKALELPLHTVLFEPASRPRYAYFLLAGLASIVTPLPNNEAAEVCCIGGEGVIGGLHLLGPAPLPTKCMMQLGGSGLRVPFADVQECFENSAELRRVVLEFVQQQAATVGQIAACNRVHTAQDRLVRWLLMAQDRVRRDMLEFTQEYLAQMIATQRTTVNFTAGALQDRGLIRYTRGVIHIVDRPGLEAAACSCYAIVRNLFERLYHRNAVDSAARTPVAASTS